MLHASYQKTLECGDGRLRLEVRVWVSVVGVEGVHTV